MRQRFPSFLAALVFVASLAYPQTVLAAPVQGSLLKIACPTGAKVDHPCKAVYFYGHDGHRHAFPNDKAYFTWYADFSQVQIISLTQLSTLPLGQNVTYRPGAKLVKFMTLDRVYAVASGGELRWVLDEKTAQDLYGAAWNKQVDDISDTFFGDYGQGSDIANASGYDRTGEITAASTIDDELDSTSRSLTIVTDRGNFTIDLITLRKDRFTMVTASAETKDCKNGCSAKPLATYAKEAQATIAIHGTYFCPPDYADCANKTNTFLSPVYDSTSGIMLNASSLQVHQGPILATSKDGTYLYYHRTKDFGPSVSDFESRTRSSLQAALANYPSLIEKGQRVVETEARLAETSPSVKSIRGGIGFNDRSVYLVIAHQATVADLASIMQALKATNALNLDGGGSAALYYDGSYVYGPGRDLPNAILFKKR